MDLFFFFSWSTSWAEYPLKNISKCCLWWQPNLDISSVFPTPSSHPSFSLIIFSFAFVFRSLSPLARLSSLSFYICFLFLHPPFLLILSLLPHPSRPCCPPILPSPVHFPPPCTLPLSGFSKSHWVFFDGMTHGTVLPDCRVSFLKRKASNGTASLPRCGVNFKSDGL